MAQEKHNDELNDLYSSPNIVRVIKPRRMRWAGHVARMGERRGEYRVSVWTLEGKRTLGKPRRRWEDNIKMDLQELGSGGVEWLDLAQDRKRWPAVVNAVMILGFHKYGEFLDQLRTGQLLKKDCSME